MNETKARSWPHRARLRVHICALSDAVERYGLFDRRNRLRAISTAQRIDGTLGLARRSRHVERE